MAPTNIDTDIETSLISDLKKSKFSRLLDIGKIATQGLQQQRQVSL